MHQTPEQRHILKTTWIAGLIFTAIYSFLFLGDGSSPGSILVRSKYAFLMPYVYYLLIWACWSWDWIVAKDYVRAGIMLGITAGFWAVGTFIIKKQSSSENGFSGWAYIKNTILLSQFLWLAVARAVMEFEWRRTSAALLTGITVFILFMLHGQGQYGLSIFALPYIIVSDYIFSGNMRETVSDFLYGPTGYMITTLGFIACQVFIVQWVYQFFYNLTDPARRSSAKGIFGKEYPRVSGRYYAAAFPVLYIFTIAAATCVVVYAAQIFMGSGYRGYTVIRVLKTSIPIFSDAKVMPWIMVPVSMYFTVVLFKIMRTLVLSRCISLNKKFGLTYLFSFVPFINIIPWIILSVTKTPGDEHDRLQYASEMNDPLKHRSMVTVNLLITLAVLNGIFSLFTGVNSGGGILGIFIILITITMYIGFVYRPDMIYGVIGIRLVFLVIVLLADRISSDARILFTFFALYSILMLFWQKKIFFPDVEMPINVMFDSERISNNEHGTQNSEVS